MSAIIFYLLLVIATPLEFSFWWLLIAILIDAIT